MRPPTVVNLSPGCTSTAIASGCARNHARHFSRSSLVYRTNSLKSKCIVRGSRPEIRGARCEICRESPGFLQRPLLHHLGWFDDRDRSEIEAPDARLHDLSIADDHHGKFRRLNVLVGGTLDVCGRNGADALCVRLVKILWKIVDGKLSQCVRGCASRLEIPRQ